VSSGGENGNVIRMGEKQEGIEIKRKGERKARSLSFCVGWKKENVSGYGGRKRI
jgi:hypothetical protein